VALRLRATLADRLQATVAELTKIRDQLQNIGKPARR
jgi:hypothetical protein